MRKWDFLTHLLYAVVNISPNLELYIYNYQCVINLKKT